MHPNLNSSTLPLTCLLVLLLFMGCKATEQTSPVDAQKAQNALWDAAISGNVEALTQAIEAGANVNAVDDRINTNGRRALNWAAWHNHIPIIHALLEHGAEINGKNYSGYTAVHHAAEAGSIEAARVLIEAGADVSLPNNAGQTPLQRATREGHKEIVQLLETARGKK